MVNKDENARQASDILMKNTEGSASLRAIVNNPKKEDEALKILSAIRGAGGKAQLDLLNEAAFNVNRSEKFRNKAFESIGGSWGGEDMVLKYLKEGKIDKKFIPSAVQGVSKAWRKQVRTEAQSYLPNAPAASTTTSKMPEISEMVGMKGDVVKGSELFKTFCGICHQVKNEGIDFGPKLSAIGSKLSKEGQYSAILNPDAGISFGYEGWKVQTKNGSTYIGIITSVTDMELVLKMAGGTIQSIRIKDIVTKSQMPNSLMPSGFNETLNKEELADVVEYMMSLK